MTLRAVLSRSLTKLCCRGWRTEQNLRSSFLHVTHNLAGFRHVVGGPPFVLPGPRMSGWRTDESEGVSEEQQKHVFLRWGRGDSLLSVPFATRLSEVGIWRRYIWCIDRLWQSKCQVLFLGGWNI